MTDYEVIAREVSGYQARFEALERRLAEVEKVNARLEAAALTTARALEAMRSEEEREALQEDVSEAALRSERYEFHPRESE